MGGSVLFRFAIFGSPKTQIYTKAKSGKEEKKKRWVMGLQGFIKDVCQFSGSISMKRRGHWVLDTIWGDMLEPAYIMLKVQADGLGIQRVWLACSI